MLTNSLASTDASYAVAALYPWLGSLADTGLTLSAYGETRARAEQQSPRR